MLGERARVLLHGAISPVSRAETLFSRKETHKVRTIQFTYMEIIIIWQIAKLTASQVILTKVNLEI